MVRGLLFIASMGIAGPVLAQATPGEGEILIDATGPNAKHGESTRVTLPPRGTGPAGVPGGLRQGESP